MTSDTNIPSNMFKEGKYQKEYHNEEIPYPTEKDFETELAYKWLQQQKNEELDEKQESIKRAARAPHYNNIAFGHQYIQLVAELTRDMEPSQAAIVSHIYKYIFRLGRKDDPVQEAEKAIMYLKILIQYFKGTGGGHFDMPEELM